MNYGDPCEFYNPERDKWLAATYGGRNGFHALIPVDEGQDDDMIVVEPLKESDGLIVFMIPEFVRPRAKKTTKKKP